MPAAPRVLDPLRISLPGADSLPCKCGARYNPAGGAGGAGSAAPRGLHFPPGAARGASGVTQTCCPRRGAPVTVTALSRLVLHPRVPVRAPGLQSSRRAGGTSVSLPAVAQHRGGSAHPLSPGFGNPAHAEGGKTPPGPRRAGAGSVTQCTAGELGHGGGGGSDSVLPVPSRHRWVLGAGPLPAGAGAGRDAPRMQRSTRKSFMRFFVR